MWVRTFQFAWCLLAHEQQFPVGSSGALGRDEGAVRKGLRRSSIRDQGETEQEAPSG